MRALLVVNPGATATTARARDVLAHALASETRLEVVETKAKGHATELAAAAVGEFDVVVALGGDGTVNEVANGLLTSGPRPGLPALAVVPGGSTNVFARALGLPNSPVEATSVLLDALRSERRRTVGLGTADGRWFTFNAGLGLDGSVVRRVDDLRAAGHRASPVLYTRAGVRQFFRSPQRRRPLITLEVPGREPVPLGLALVCNTAPWSYLGGRPLDPCPGASFDLGLDAFGLRRLGPVSLLWHLRQALAADPRPRGRGVVGVHDVPELVLTARVPQPLQVDGEDLGDRTRVVFRSVPGALSVVA
jgi:diacylglycerol kinase family enzyme